MKKLFAFTLAEVLITLAIIGFVAVLTIPRLVENYQSRSWNTASEVFQKKLGEALKSMNALGTLAGYATTEDFVNELSKHIKITKICKNDDITSCFADKVYWSTTNEEIDMSKVKTSTNFGINGWNTNTVAVQFVNGVNAVLAYNPECTQNPYSNQVTGTNCIAILYDVDGFKKPNTYQKDLRGLNVTLNDKNCGLILANGLCFSTPKIPEPMSYEDCMAQKDELGINGCYYDDDYWAGAVKACKDMGGKIVSNESFKANIAPILYPDANGYYDWNVQLDHEAALSLGFVLNISKYGKAEIWGEYEDPFEANGFHNASVWRLNETSLRFIRQSNGSILRNNSTNFVICEI